MEVEANLLREMQTNLTNYVNELEAQDNNTILGPFHQRLDATQANMKTLLAFVGIPLQYVLIGMEEQPQHKDKLLLAKRIPIS